MGIIKRKKSRFHFSVFLGILLGATIIWILIYFVIQGVTMKVTLSYMNEKNEKDLIATATSLAESDMVRQSFIDGYVSEELMAYLDNLVSLTESVDVITIADTDSVRLYHINHERIGETFVGGDQGTVLTGESYFSDAEGTMGYQHRYLTPVYIDGEIVGFVLTSSLNTRTAELQNTIGLAYGKMSAVLALASIFISIIAAWVLGKFFNGMKPNEFMKSYEIRNELLDNLNDGVISTDKNGTIQMMNRSAERILGQSEDLLIGKHLDDAVRTEDDDSLLNRVGDNQLTSRRNVLCTVIKQKDRSKIVGTVAILKDKNEAVRQAEELNGVRHIVDGLRANNHEFMNKLQIISGLLQLGKSKDALNYIGTVTEAASGFIDPVLEHIQNPSVAALLLGKLPSFRELDISLDILSNSNLPCHSQYLSTENLITVVGNLLENAIEAVNSRDDMRERDVTLQITEDSTGLIIVVSDTGIGIAKENLPYIFKKDFSTKASEGRGVGMSLIRSVTERCGGSIEVDSEPGEGTTFTLIFNQKRG
ncbi:MAG: sensor histidine kinase [Lachnospiraceae bacterium]|nr:sensor histidine kinase [Lachnospiraceae bacterium]